MISSELNPYFLSIQLLYLQLAVIVASIYGEKAHIGYQRHSKLFRPLVQIILQHEIHVSVKNKPGASFVHPCSDDFQRVPLGTGHTILQGLCPEPTFMEVVSIHKLQGRLDEFPGSLTGFCICTAHSIEGIPVLFYHKQIHTNQVLSSVLMAAKQKRPFPVSRK